MFNHASVDTSDDWTGAFRRVTVQTVILQGRLDPIVHPDNATALHDGIGGSRLVFLSESGHELRGEDILEPAGRRGKKGKIDFAIRFHLAPRIEVGLSEDGRGAGLALPDGSYWQLRLGGDQAGQELVVEDSLWIDGQGRPRATRQLVITGLTSRSGERFPWLLKRMG